MFADFARRSLAALAGLAVAAAGSVLLVSAKGGLEGGVPATTERAIGHVLAALHKHDSSAKGDAETRIAALREARAQLVSLLARRPSDGDQWALLAQIEARFVGFDPGVKAALDMSRLTAPLEKAAIEKRIRLGVQLLDELDGPERTGLDNDLRTYLGVPEPRHRVIATLADAVRGQDNARLAAIRAAVARDAPQWSTTFEQFLAKPPQF